MIEDTPTKPLFILAPMDDVTDTVFRRVVGECAAPDVYFTEFVNVDGLQSPGRPKLIKKLLFTTQEQPLIVQLWGKNPDNFYKTAQELADGTLLAEIKNFGLQHGFAEAQIHDINFAGIDLNMGCPVKAVIQNGCCSALMNERDLALAIIQAVKDGSSGLPVSVKTRVGFRAVDMTWPQLILEQKLNMLTIHGRTVKQQSLVPADWDLIGQVREMRDSLKLNTLIIGNGDVTSRAHGMELIERYSLDGVMIGRGIFHDPFVFAKRSLWQSYGKEQRIALFRRHIALFAQTWGAQERPVHTLNRFCKIYINGFDGAKELRERLMAAESVSELQMTLDAAEHHS